MNSVCSGNCATCPFAAEAGRETGAKGLVKVAVTGGQSCVGSAEAVLCHKGWQVCLFPVPSLSDLEEMPKDSYDVVINEVDATQLFESLILTTQIIDMDVKAVISLCSYDRLVATGHRVDVQKLGGLLGMDVIPSDIREGRGLDRLLDTVIGLFEGKNGGKHIHVPYGQDVEKAIDRITREISRLSPLAQIYHDRFLAVHLLEDTSHTLPYLENDPQSQAIKALAAREAAALSLSFGENAGDYIHSCRHGFINGALQETLHHGPDSSDHSISQKIDAVLTNRWLGLPLLVLLLFGVFQVTFTLGAWPQRWIEGGIDALCAVLEGVMRPGWFTSLLLDGVLQGVGAVLAFLPNIILIFFFLSLLEDSGYISRAAYVMDKLMHRVGLHGRSFVPMLIGFGCNVPAIMAARGIEDRKDRALTMLMIPFMSCSARLPVYMFLVNAFFERYKALVMICIYAGGILLSILFAFVMKRTRWFRKEEGDYVSELLPWRRPTLRNSGRHIWERTSDYLKKISTVIVAASVVIWILEYFPAARTMSGTVPEASALASIGRFLAPVFSPLGFDWKMNVCLLTGLPAKEAIVSTIAILSPEFTSASALSFMAFTLLYFPCIATVSALRHEIGRRWAAFTVVHSLVLAWLCSFIVYILAGLFV